MDDDFPKSPFYRGMMTGLFTGIVVTVVGLAFNQFYRMYTGFALSELINVASLIFFINLLFLVLGILYYTLTNAFRRGELVFIVAVVLLTLVCTWRAEYVIRAHNEVENQEFRHLLMGLIIIFGACGAFLLPYLYHSRKFQDSVI